MRSQLILPSFNARFAPWLTTFNATLAYSSSLSHSSHKGEGPYKPATSAFLQAAQWTLASRHLPTSELAPSTTKAKVYSLRKRLARTLERLTFRALLGLDNSLPALRALIILAQWTGKLPTRTDVDERGDGSATGTRTNGNGNGHLHPPTAKADGGDDDDEKEEDEDYDVAKEGVAFDGEMFLAAAVRISAKMHLELDVQMALANKQNLERPSSSSEPGGAAANGGSPSAAKIAETLDRARVVSRHFAAIFVMYNACSTNHYLDYD